MQKFLFKYVANLLQSFEPRLNILMYHRILPEPDPLYSWTVDAKQFRNHMKWISGVFNVIPLSEAVDQLKNGTLKRRSLAITFDDGYKSNISEVLPTLREFGFHATFFCTSAWLEGGQMWNDKVIESIRRWPDNTINIEELNLVELPVSNYEEKKAAIESILSKLKYQKPEKREKISDALASQVSELPQLMMKPEHLKLLHTQGMEIGGHTHSHPILAYLDKESLKKELTTNKQLLENIIGKPIKLFAFPNGKPETDFSQDQIQQIIDSGYIAAVTTETHIASQRSKLFGLPRFTPWDTSSFSFLFRLLLNDIIRLTKR